MPNTPRPTATTPTATTPTATNPHPATPAATSRTVTSGAPLPRRMRAVTQRRYGDTDVLAVRDVPVPAPGPGEVLVEVHAAGVDRGVWHLVTGRPYVMRLAGFGLTGPRQPVPGLDVAGRIVAVGDGVTRFTVGDEVFGIGTGTYAEYARAREDRLVQKPAGLGYVEAAAVAVSGLTAWQAVHDVGRVRDGDRVLVLGASGGVGSLAVQLAVAAGAEVTGVSSAAKADLVRSLGAARVLDYATTDPTAGDVRYDVVLDVGGRRRLSRLRRALTITGTLVIVGGEGGGRWTGGAGRQLRALALSRLVPQRLTTFVSRERGDGIERLRAAIESGDLVVPVGRTYPLDEVPRVLRDLTAGRVRGKAVVEVRRAR